MISNDQTKVENFFTVSVPEAIIKIRENSKVKFDEVFYKSPEEIMKEEIKREEERRRHKEKIESDLREKNKRKRES